VLLERALALEPDYADAHAALGNLQLRSGKLVEAIASYERAVALSPDDAAMRLALAELILLQAGEEAAQPQYDAAFARRRIFSPVRPPRSAPQALALALPGPWPRNTPLDFIVDRSQVALHKWYLTEDAAADAAALPPHDVVFNALSATEAGAAALAFAQRFVDGHDRPTINRPDRVGGTARPVLAATLCNVAGCTVPPTVRVPAEAVDQAEIAFPRLVRPVDRHGGRDLARVDDPQELAEHVARTAAGVYDVSAFIDARCTDGYYRKYRVMFVDGEPLPYHLAIDTNWMLHWYRTPMAGEAWMRDEEARFLRDPAGAFPDWSTTMPAIAAALGLDYAGIDCTVGADGAVLVFEADTAMLVHGNDPGDRFAYKQPAVARISAALQGLIVRRAYA
jgi:hypothetical protein